MRKELGMLDRSKLTLSLACAVTLIAYPAFGANFMPNNASPVDWNQADWTDLSGVPFAGPPGGSDQDHTKIGRTFSGSVVNSSVDVVINLDSTASLGVTNNEVGFLELATYNTGVPEVNSATLNIMGTGGTTLNVNGNTQLGQRHPGTGAGTGTATLLQTGGDVNFGAGNNGTRSFALSGANALAEFAGGTATFSRVKVGATPGNVGISSGTNVFKVSGGDVTLGTNQFSDFRVFAGGSVQVTGGTLTGVNAGSGAMNLESSAAGSGSVDVSGGVLTGINEVRGLDVNLSGGSFVVGDDPTGTGVDFTTLRLSAETGASGDYTMSGSGTTVFPILSTGEAAKLRLKDSSNADLSNGTVEIDFTNYSPVLGDRFTLLAEEGLGSATLSTANIGAAPAGFDWDTSRWLDIFRLELIAATGLTGDYNGNGTVDAADYTVWRDGNSPDSTIAGYNTWVANFGNSSTSTSTSIPEPTSVALLLLGSLLTLSRRKSG